MEMPVVLGYLRSALVNHDRTLVRSECVQNNWLGLSFQFSAKEKNE